MKRIDPKHMERLLSPDRRQWHDPEVVLDTLGLSAGMEVADIGSGPGFFTLPLAVRVAPGGKVYAVDVEPLMLQHLGKRAGEEGVDNIELLVAEDGSLPLSDDQVDAALMVNVLHESDEPAALLREVLRSLRPGGAFTIVEWKKDQTQFGPPLEHRISEADLSSLLQQSGFISITPFHVGDNHYGLRAQKGVSE